MKRLLILALFTCGVILTGIGEKFTVKGILPGISVDTVAAQNVPATITSGGSGSGAVATGGGAYFISPVVHAPAGCPNCFQVPSTAFGSLPACTAALGGTLTQVTGVTAGAEGATCAGAGAATQLAYCNGVAAAWKCF